MSWKRRVRFRRLNSYSTCKMLKSIYLRNSLTFVKLVARPQLLFLWIQFRTVFHIIFLRPTLFLFNFWIFFYASFKNRIVATYDYVHRWNILSHFSRIHIYQTWGYGTHILIFPSVGISLSLVVIFSLNLIIE